MKKNLIILVAVTLSLISCNKEPANCALSESNGTETEISFELTAIHPDGASTRAVKTGWEDGDVIFVFFNNIAAPKYLRMSYDGSVWSSIQMNGASVGTLGLSEGSSGTMRAVFLPFGNTAEISNEGTSFTFSETKYSYYLTATLDYMVSDGKISGAFDMKIPDGYIQFFLDDDSASSSTAIEIREPHLIPQGIASIASDGTIVHTTIASGAPVEGYVYDKANKESGESKGYLFSAVLDASSRNVSTTYYFTMLKGGWYGTYYSKKFENKTWYRGNSDGRALKMPSLSDWTVITYNKPVDLGTDVDGKRIYWSDCNLGATKPKEYGDYFAWGETEPKTTFTYDNYKWLNTANMSITKYNDTDNLRVLETIDDAARAQLDGLWHVPTNDEWAALNSFSNTVLAWDTYQYGVAGLSVRRKDSIESIFLPAAGYRSNGDVYKATTGCYYWFPQIPNTTDLRIIKFESAGSGVSSSLQTYSWRFNYGCTVRPASY
jgi:hypothetical protein